MSDFMTEMQGTSSELVQLRWSGTFREYLEIYQSNKYPNLNALSHQRIYDMIMAAGTEKVDHFGTQRVRYHFFENTLFGIEDTIDQFMSYLHSAAQRTEASRRILLIYGPPSSGKSEMISLIKRGLEQYSRTDRGAIFSCAGSKMHENPFLLVPNHLRERFEKEFGVQIEGHLSPITKWRLDNEYNGDFMNFPVERMFFDESSRVGIGTWLPQDTKCVTADALILTPEGIVRGQEFLDGNSPKELVGEKQNVAVKNVHINGIRPVKKVKLRGMSVKATGNHRFITVNSDGKFEWTHVDDILGKCVPIKVGTNVFGSQTSLKCVSEDAYTNRHENVTLPKKLTPELARMAGYLIAEGYCDDNQIAFCNTQHELNQDFSRILMSEFLIEAPVYNRYDRTGGDTIVMAERGLVISKQRFVDFVNLNFDTNNSACEKRIPELILKTSKECQIQFLEGLFLGDGCAVVREETPSISYSSCSEQLIQELQMMLINLGVYGCVSPYVNPKYPTHTQYRLTVEGKDALELAAMLPRFMKNRKVSFGGEFGRHRYESFGALTGLISDIRDSIKGSRSFVDRRYNISTKNVRHPSRKTLQKWLTKLNDPTLEWKKPENKEELIERISNLLSYRCIPVVNVTSAGSEMTFDPEVDDPKHTYVFHGMLSHNSQDLSELVGGIDLARIQDYSEGDPRAYNFDGELEVANRGVMEFIEGLKADEKFLRALLTASQEKVIKAPRFGLIYVDTMIIVHTNEKEFIDFLKEPRYEAYHDRMVMIRAPYNLGLDNEISILNKLLGKSDAVKDIHIAPHTLDVAAMFAVLTRLESNDNETLMNKLRLYNKEHVKGKKVADALKLRKSAPREGMGGITPRFVIDQVSAAISRAKDIPQDYILPLDVLRMLNESISKSDKFNEDQKQKYAEYLASVRDELNEEICNDIQKAFFVAYDDEMKALCETYLDHVEAYLDDTKPINPTTGEEIEVDEKLMDSVEGHIGISGSGRVEFRNEIMRAFGSARRRQHEFDYSQHVQLREAIQKQLFHERKSVIRMTVSSRNPDPEAASRINGVIERLAKDHGYTEASANAILRYASSQLFEKF